MAEIDQDVVQPQIGVEAVEVPETEEVVEQEQEVEQEPAGFSQEQVNQIVSQRIAEERAGFAAQMEEFQRQSAARQAAIEQGVRQLTQGQQQTHVDPRAKQLEDLLAPALNKIRDDIRRELAPIHTQAAHSFEANFWANKPKAVPDSVKQTARNIFRQNFVAGQTDPAELLEAAYSVAARQYQEQMWNGGSGVVVPTTPVVNKPAPRIPANSAASGELGRSKAPVALGGNKQLGWEDQLDEWANNDVWPGQEDEFAKRKGRVR